MPAARRLIDNNGDEYVQIARPLLTMEEVEQMSPAEISQDWQRVSECLESGRRQSDVDAAVEAEDGPPASPSSTGTQVGDGSGGSGEDHQPLSTAYLRKQSPAWHMANRERVDAWLASGGSAAA